mgnify:CR=1 FL=1
MEKIIVQTGAKTYQITDQDGNDLGVFRFIPSDAGILKRYKEAAAFFTGINDKIKDKDFEEILPNLEKKLVKRLICCLVLLYQRVSSRLPVRLPFSTAVRCLQSRLLQLLVELLKKS